MGALQDYLKEVRRLNPETAQPEILTFRVDIGSAGQIWNQSPSIRVMPGFMFSLEQIRAGCPVPPFGWNDDPDPNQTIPDPNDPNKRIINPDYRRRPVGLSSGFVLTEYLPFISFNVLNEGRQRPIFKAPIAMNLFINACGTTEGQKFPVPFTFFEGADVSVEWYVDVEGLLLQWAYAVAPTFNPRRILQTKDVSIRTEFYVYLIGTLIRAEQVV